MHKPAVLVHWRERRELDSEDTMDTGGEDSLGNSPALLAADPAEVIDIVSSVVCDRGRDPNFGSILCCLGDSGSFSTFGRGANSPN